MPHSEENGRRGSRSSSGWALERTHRERKGDREREDREREKTERE